jgi:hypothetical protein
VTFTTECVCDKCRNPINANAEIFCFWCMEELHQTIVELREIISALEKKDAVKLGK